MTEKEFFKKIINGKKDSLALFLNLLNKQKIKFCVIGGLAVNAYADPVVSLDLDVVIVSQKLDMLLPVLKEQFKMQAFPNSINLSEKNSQLRIQIQTDLRYQDFLKKAKVKNVLGYKMPVATIEDVLQGKIWAALAPERRPSKRQKDLADILRLVEKNKNLSKLLPEDLKKRFVL